MDALPWLDGPAEAVQKVLTPLLGADGRKDVKDILKGTKLSEQILDALPEMELAVPADELVWRPGPFARALASLPVVVPGATFVPLH